MAKGKTKHNLVDMGDEVTVEVGISDLFNEVHEDGSEDQEIIDQLTPKDKDDKPEETPTESEKPEEEVKLTFEGKVHEYRTNLLAQAFPEIAQDLADKRKLGRALPGRKKIKKKVIKRAAEIAMEDSKVAETINNSGGINVFIEELEETFEYPPILAQYEKLIDHLIIEVTTLSNKTVTKPTEVEKPKDEPVEESVEEEPVLLYVNQNKPKDVPVKPEVPATETTEVETSADETEDVPAEETLIDIIVKKLLEDESVLRILKVYLEAYPDLTDLLQDKENVADLVTYTIKTRFEKLVVERPELKEMLNDEKALVKLVIENDLYTINFISVLHDVMKEMLPPSALKAAKKIASNQTLIFNMFQSA
jgi:hypothetical protein